MKPTGDKHHHEDVMQQLTEYKELMKGTYCPNESPIFDVIWSSLTLCIQLLSNQSGLKEHFNMKGVGGKEQIHTSHMQIYCIFLDFIYLEGIDWQLKG